MGEMDANIDNYSHHGQAPALGWWLLGSGDNVPRGDVSGGWAAGSSVMNTF